ncbi:hypothetical protein G6F58_013618 [Rhizopus delemar]|nr:hypothetical protein G6F58_013618 [Rhizopus delemar]
MRPLRSNRPTSAAATLASTKCVSSRRALRCGVDVHLRAAAEGRQAVHARQQDLLETTVAIHQAALAVADHDLDGPEHGILSLYGSGGSTRWDETS